MHNVTVISRHQAEVNSLGLLGPIISITGSDERKAHINHDMYPCILRLQFDDLLRKTPGMVLFNSQHAEEIRSAAHDWSWASNIIVHCRAGMSRSVAVGKWIATAHDRVLVLCATNTDQFYNAHVYNELNRPSRIKDIKSTFV